MSTKSESWTRLKSAVWCSVPSIANKNDSSAKFQTIAEGVGKTVFDEYSVTFSEMGSSLTPESLLVKFAGDPNGTINNSTFNAWGVFKKRAPKRILISDIYDIDARGPDDCSIVIVKTSDGFGKNTVDSWFDIQTIKCKKTGTHPECGAREFGFEYSDSAVTFYTRGVSRPANQLVRIAGTTPQNSTWTALMEGFKKVVVDNGGKWDGNAIHSERNNLGP